MNDETSSRWTPWTELGGDYDLISPERSKAILAEVIAKLPERVLMLQEYVRRSPESARFNADRSDASLGELGRWVKRTARIERRIPDRVVIRAPGQPDDLLRKLHEFYANEPADHINEPFGYLSMDIGLYLAECLSTRCPFLKWKRCAAPSYPYFNHPILWFRGNIGFAPFEVGRTAIFAIAKGLQGEGYPLDVVMGAVKEANESRVRR